jgi:predicted MPP superfamily phosphohydrolase
MKKFFLIIIAVYTILNLNVQAGPKLQFKNGSLKIVQFTDTHIESKEKKNLEVYETIKKVLASESPDFAILTGDVVTEDNPREALRRIAAIFEQTKTPWAMVFGNHESEHNLARKELATFLQKLPLCMNNEKNETHGNSNFVLPVYGNGNKPAALLYCMDSNEYSTLEPTVEGWGWFDFSQVGWYRRQSSEWKLKNNGKPLPAIAFFHIPLPEYTEASNNKAIPPIGVKNEDECSPGINTGMFAAMLECGDVMGTFVGHDHINDYIGIHYGIALAYGRVTKTMADPDDPKAGGRVIVLKEGIREFDTWIREDTGNKVLECNWPGSFKPKQVIK